MNLIFTTKKRSNLDHVEEFIPVRKKESFIGEDGNARILISRQKNSIFKGFNPYSSSRREYIKFDEFGTTIWIAMDRTKNIEKLMNEFIDRYGETANFAREKVRNFILNLYKNDLIYFESPLSQN